MKKILKKSVALFSLVVFLLLLLTPFLSVNTASAASMVPVYSFTRLDSGVHFYTTVESERTSVLNGGFWRYDGVAGYVFNYRVNNSSPLYRFYNNNNGDYVYTTSESEKLNLLSQNSNWWRYEGTVGYVATYQLGNLTPLYRYVRTDNFNLHAYTFSESEKTALEQNTLWRSEGVAAYISATNYLNNDGYNYYNYGNNYNNLSVSCSPNVLATNTGKIVYWNGYATGGNGAYTYSWSGTDGLSGLQSSVSTSYSYPGTKIANVTVYSGGMSATTACNSPVSIYNNNTNYFYNGYNYNYGYGYGNSNLLYGTCVADKTTTKAGEVVTWNAVATGGNSLYSYSWSGDEDLSGIGSAVSKIYQKNGSKSATVTIVSGGQSITRNCTNGVVVSSGKTVDSPTYITPVSSAPTVKNTDLTVNCGPDIQNVSLGNSVVWLSNVSGGNGDFVYSWEGSDGLSGTQKYLPMAYLSSGNKVAVLNVKSGSQSVSAVCASLLVSSTTSSTDSKNSMSASAVFGNWSNILVVILSIIAISLLGYVIYFAKKLNSKI